jgi:hypothetical protein
MTSNRDAMIPVAATEITGNEPAIPALTAAVLTGSPKMVEWAAKIRTATLATLHPAVRPYTACVTDAKTWIEDGKRWGVTVNPETAENLAQMAGVDMGEDNPAANDADDARRYAECFCLYGFRPDYSWVGRVTREIVRSRFGVDLYEEARVRCGNTVDPILAR